MFFYERENIGIAEDVRQQQDYENQQGGAYEDPKTIPTCRHPVESLDDLRHLLVGEVIYACFRDLTVYTSNLQLRSYFCTIEETAKTVTVVILMILLENLTRTYHGGLGWLPSYS